MHYANAEYTLLLSSTCNLQCSYCFARGVLRGLDHDTLSLDEIRRFVAFAYTGNTDHEKIITIVGGEPSLHPDFFGIVEFLLGEQFQLRVFTNGIWPRKTIDQILSLSESRRTRIGFLVNYNHDIPKGQRDRLHWFCANLLHQFPSMMGINIQGVDRRHLQTIDLCAEYKVNSLRVGISQPIGGQDVYVRFQDYPHIGDWICELMEHAVTKHVRLFMDCSHPYCMFDERQHRFIARLQSRQQLRRYNPDCAPRILVGPGLQTWRCYNNHDISEKKTIHHFGDVSELEHYYSRKLNHWNIGLFPDEKCRTCHYRIERLCTAGCAGFVLRHDQGMLEHIRQHVAPRLTNCILRLNNHFLDRVTESRASFSLYLFGRKYSFPITPYRDVLNAIDGKRSFGEILRELGISLRPNQRSVFVKLIEAKVLTVVTTT